MTAPESAARIAVILAGGRATRMGGAKATAQLGDETLLARAVRLAREAGLEPVVCARGETALGATDAEVWREPAADGSPHPLAGIAAALERAGAPILALPVDLPFLTPTLLQALAARSGPLAVVGESAGAGLRPAALVLRADPSLAAPLRAAAVAGAPALRTLTAQRATLLSVAELDPSAGEHTLLNVNDAAGLRRAEQLLAGG